METCGFGGRGMCEYGAYGPAALPVPVDCANAHLCCKVMETCGCWGRGMCKYGAYGPSALPVPVDCANAHLCCKVMETCGCLGPWHVWIRRIWAGCIASTSGLCECAPVLQGVEVSDAYGPGVATGWGDSDLRWG